MAIVYPRRRARWMISASKTMLPIFCRANRSRAASRRKPLKPHCVSGTGPVTQNAARPWNTLPSSRRCSGWLRRRSLPSGWTRLPSATSFDVERVGQQGQLVGRRGQVGVGEHDVVGVAGEHAGAHGAALAGVRLAQQAQGWALVSRPPQAAPRRSPPFRRSCRRRRPAPRLRPCRMRAGRPLCAGPVRWR